MTEGGQTFFYNDKNGEFQWSDPVVEDKNKSILQNNNNVVNTTTTVTNINTNNSNNTTNKVNPELGDWRPYKDPETGSVFWYNIVTKISQWECPVSNPLANTTTNNKDDDSEAIVVNNDDDLGI